MIVLILAIAVISAYYIAKTNSQTSGLGLIDDSPEIYYEGSRYRNFESEELGVSFTYPAAWSEITEWIGVPPEELKEFRMESTLSAYDVPFLMLVSEGETMPRDGWWGDIAVEASSEDAVREFCDSYKNNDAYYVQPNEACEILINDHGVAFARIKGDTSWFGWDLEDTHVYITFHPDHPFYGIALSAQSLRQTDLEETVGSTEKAVHEIANSLSFTE